MTLHTGLLNGGFKLPTCEKHFHDHDETWLILKGKGTSYWIDHTGRREDFNLVAGDVWLIPAGYEHGSEGLPETAENSEDFTISVFNGTQPPGSHKPGHYYVEQERYIPSFELKKISTSRYTEPSVVPTTMRGIFFPHKGEIAFEELPTPECEPETVLCETLYTGLTNGTERNALMGGNYGGTWPFRSGYQNVGRVLAVGEGVEGFRAGDTVFSGDFCKHTQYFKAPATDCKLIIRVPDAIDPKHAALFGAASIGTHDVRRAGVALGENIVIVGAGLIGQFTAQAARLSGAVVTVCDVDNERLTLAKKSGAHNSVAVTADVESWDAVRELGPFDVVFEDSGGQILDNIIRTSWNLGILKRHSRIIMVAGRHRVDYSFNAAQRHELTVFHVSHFNKDDLQQACRFVAEGLLQIGPVIRDVVEIDQAISIYHTLRDNPNDILGVVFDWTSMTGETE